MLKRWIWPFELEEQIGAGGMGVVYRARYVKNDRKVALKLLPAEVAANPTIAARFERELEILKDLRHPHVVHCFGGTCEGAQRFYAMELVQGGTIESLLQERGRLPWGKVIEYALQICSALAYAHAQGIIHRDIKPGNLLLTPAGKIKLGDFGLALVSASNKLTAEGKTLGTLQYMAPEQIRGTPPVSHKTDLYAYGCVLFEMLTGRPPFLGNTAAEVLHQHIHKAPPRVMEFCPDCPEELDAIISELLRKDPEARPIDAAAVADRLKSIDLSIRVKSPRSPQSLSQFDSPLKSDTGLGSAPTRTVDIPTGMAPPTATTTAPFDTRMHWLRTLGLMLLTASITWWIASSYRGNAYAMAEAQLVAALSDPSADVRIAAARALGELGETASGTTSALMNTLGDSDPRVRSEVIKSLVKIGPDGKAASGRLNAIERNDEHWEVRDQAKLAIEAFRDMKRGRSYGGYVFGFGLLLFGATGAWLWLKKARILPDRQ